MSTMRSASSSTTVRTALRLMSRRSTRSSRRPGQATTMSTPRRNDWRWGPYPVPPYTATTRLAFGPSRLASTSRTCSASSRVGTNTSAVGCLGVAPVALVTSGIPKASVLPDPVGACPQMSRPAKASGIVAV